MKPMTLREAAKAAGKGTAAIKQAIDSGQLSVSGGGKDADGKNIPYQIDPSELNRVFGIKVNPSTGEIQPLRAPKDRASVVSLGVSGGDLGPVLEAKLQAAEAMLAEVQKNLDRERERADRAEAERRALLEAPKEEIQRERAELARERAERERERAEAQQREEERRAEAERLRADIERERQERDRLAREAEELRQALLKPKGFWSRITGR